MKPNRWLLLPLLGILAGGCATNYHGLESRESSMRTPPSLWDNALNGGTTNAPVSPTAWWKNFHDGELDSLVDRAVKSNLDLQIAQARVREARAQYSIAVADFFPTVDASGSYERQRQSHNQPLFNAFQIPSSAFQNNVYQAGFDASWEIDVFGGKRHAAGAARAEVDAFEYSQRDTLMTLLGEVARNYVDVRGNQRRLAIANDNIEAQTKALT